MKLYKKEFYQELPVSLEEAWDFFSFPDNLLEITPPDMTFRPAAPAGRKMYEGMIITYTVVPFLGIKLNWVTEITTLKDQQYFIDEQRFGPFGFWHHEHHFKKTAGGVLMHDIISYGIGWWFIGNIANSLMVSTKLNKVFQFRYNKIQSLLTKSKTKDQRLKPGIS